MSKRTLLQKKFHFIQEEKKRERKQGFCKNCFQLIHKEIERQRESQRMRDSERERERPYLAFSGLLNIFDKTICLNVCQFIMTRVNLKNLSLFAF